MQEFECSTHYYIVHVQYLSNLEMHRIYWDSCITEVDAPWSALTQSFLCHAEGVDGTENEETSDAIRLGIEL